MAVGLSVTNLATNWLNMLRGVAFPTPPGATLYVGLHINDPGPSGTSGLAANTTRVAFTLAAPTTTNGQTSVALVGTQPTWTMTANQGLNYISVWDSITAGKFLWSATLAGNPRNVVTGDTFTLTACGLTLSPVAV